ncbi:response regulator [Larkinella rosea]|uniref:Response regulator n=1 Tax=Larkinella rosea TaxID=2025312 RepID=A0A3P1BTT8_9BACT|nr:response regulator [Larkinella rosea]RRB04276.1 response regulator [Larkinella rosea]
MKPLILIVDDDEDDLWLMQKAMLEIGGMCHLNPFSDAAGLLTYLEKATAVPDLILIDYHLPRMDGLELTEYLRSRPALQTVPLAWMSSEIDPIWEVRCRELNVSWCWIKPNSYTAWQAFMSQLCKTLMISRLE